MCVMCCVSFLVKWRFYVTCENLICEMCLRMVKYRLVHFFCFVLKLGDNWEKQYNRYLYHPCIINRCTLFSIIWIKPIICHVICVLFFCLKVTYWRGSHCITTWCILELDLKSVISRQIISTFRIPFSSYNHLLLKWAKLSFK